MACKSRSPENKFNFLRWDSIDSGVVGDLPVQTKCDIVIEALPTFEFTINANHGVDTIGTLSLQDLTAQPTWIMPDGERITAYTWTTSDASDPSQFNGTNKTIGVVISDATPGTRVSFPNAHIVGTLDLSSIKIENLLDLSGNPSMTELTLSSTSNTNALTNVSLYSISLPTIDLSKLTNVTLYEFGNNDILSSITFPTSIVANVEFDYSKIATGTNVTNPGEGLSAVGNPDYSGFSSSDLNGFNWTTVNGENDTLTSLDLSDFSGVTDDITVELLNACTSITKPSVTATGGTNFTFDSLAVLAGTLDLSYIPSGSISAHSNPLMTGVTFNSGGTLTQILIFSSGITSLNLDVLTSVSTAKIYNNSSLASITMTTVSISTTLWGFTNPGLSAQNWRLGLSVLASIIQIHNNGMDNSEVNNNIDQCYTARATLSTGTVLTIGTDNAAPSGTYQAPPGFVLGVSDGAPTSQLEKVYVLVNNYNWTVTYFDGATDVTKP